VGRILRHGGKMKRPLNRRDRRPADFPDNSFYVNPPGTGIAAVYERRPGASVFHLVECLFEGGPPGPRISVADVQKLIADGRLAVAALEREELERAAWFLEQIRRRAVAGVAIEGFVAAERERRHRRLEAIAWLRRDQQFQIERRKKVLSEHRKLNGAGAADEIADGLFQEERAVGAALDHFPGTQPLPRLELAWHAAATALGWCFLAYFDPGASWYPKAPAIRLCRSGSRRSACASNASGRSSGSSERG
jgi:hypothetical protein